MEKETNKILEETNELLKSCRQLDQELRETKRCVDFLLNEYKTNKRWFKTEGGRVTVEDVIKASFEFGWASHRNFEHREDRMVEDYAEGRES